MKLGVVGGWYKIFQLDGYIFFGTASRFHRHVKRCLEATDASRRKRGHRDKFLIFDLTAVPGMDATAAIVFIKV